MGDSGGNTVLPNCPARESRTIQSSPRIISSLYNSCTSIVTDQLAQEWVHRVAALFLANGFLGRSALPTARAVHQASKPKAAENTLQISSSFKSSNSLI